MNVNQDINELLNSHIDGELTSQQSGDLEQLLENNPPLQRRLRSLKQVKELLYHLPRFEAPDDLPDQVRDTLERRALFGDNVTEMEPRPRHIIFQKLKAVAAVVGLSAVLSVIVYSIVAPPQSGTDAVYVNHGNMPEVVSSGRRGELVRGTLVLEGTVITGIDNVLMRSIQSHGLTPFVEKETSGGISVYVVRCHKNGTDLLLSDLREVWERPEFNRATFHLNTGQLSSSIRIEAVSVEQVLSVIKQPNPDERIKMAKRASVQNSMLEMTPSAEVLASMASIEEQRGLRMPPKPMLTGEIRHTPLTSEVSVDDVPVVITIMLKSK